MKLHHVASLVFDQPLLLEPRKSSAIARFVAARMVSAAAPPGPNEPRRNRADIDIRNGGVAVIDATGVMVHRPGQMDADSTPLLSYEQIAMELEVALAASDVAAIVLRFDSPGGEVAGAFDLADKIFEARGVKPIVAIGADLMTSAAYLLASAADRVVVTQSGVTGSIGVVLNRLDVTKALEQEGVQVIQIAQGARKLDGSPAQPWREGSDEDDALRSYVQSMYDLFVNAVARYRGSSVNAMRATDAAVYVGADAVSAGLADEVGTLTEVVASFANQPGGSMRLTRAQLEQQYPEIVAAIRAEAAPVAPTTADAERERVLAIQKLGGPQAIVMQSVTSGRSVGEHAVAVLSAEKRDRHTRLEGLRADDADARVDAFTPGGDRVSSGEPHPLEVARQAQAYQAKQKALGIEVRIEEAVAHVRASLGLPVAPHLGRDRGES